MYVEFTLSSYFCFALRQTLVLTEKFDVKFCKSTFTSQRNATTCWATLLFLHFAKQQCPFLLSISTENKAFILAYPLLSSLRCLAMICQAECGKLYVNESLDSISLTAAKLPLLAIIVNFVI